MTDERELVESAAWVAGMRVLAGEAEARAMGMRVVADGEAWPEKSIAWFWAETSGKRCLWSAAYPMRAWNPLHDDGDAFRLAVALWLEIRVFNGKAHAGRQDRFWCTEECGDDPAAAARRAVVRAAAHLAAQAAAKGEHAA
jgi:hypothetical protein